MFLIINYLSYKAPHTIHKLRVEVKINTLSKMQKYFFFFDHTDIVLDHLIFSQVKNSKQFLVCTTMVNILILKFFDPEIQDCY